MKTNEERLRKEGIDPASMAEEEVAAAYPPPVFKKCERCGLVRRLPDDVTVCDGYVRPENRAKGQTECGGALVEDEGCHAVLHHGPGHQSTARCEVTRPHIIHGVGRGEVEWTGDEAFQMSVREPTQEEYEKDSALWAKFELKKTAEREELLRQLRYARAVLRRIPRSHGDELLRMAVAQGEVQVEPDEDPNCDLLAEALGDAIALVKA